jgi:hypothetical protein
MPPNKATSNNKYIALFKLSSLKSKGCLQFRDRDFMAGDRRRCLEAWVMMFPPAQLEVIVRAKLSIWIS